jgi:hypothetical protein
MSNEEQQLEFTKQIRQEAEVCIEHFRERSGDKLDFSIASLGIIDEILGEAHDFIDEIQEGQKNWIVAKVGSYIFEVARTNFGGNYYWYEQLSQPVLVTGEPDFEISILPFEKVRQRIENGNDDNIPFYFQGYMERVLTGKKGDRALIV